MSYQVSFNICGSKSLNLPQRCGEKEQAQSQKAGARGARCGRGGLPL